MIGGWKFLSWQIIILRSWVIREKTCVEVVGNLKEFVGRLPDLTSGKETKKSNSRRRRRRVSFVAQTKEFGHGKARENF